MLPHKLTLSLAELQAGEACVLESLDGLDAKKALYLGELGIIPGESLRFVCASPLGDLLSFTFRGTYIALRREVAACIQVRL